MTTLQTISLPQRLDAVAQLVAQGRSGELTAAALCRELRSRQEAFAELPERFRTFLDTAITRLESASLFSEESCSFSQTDLLDALSIWVEKARAAG